jgi:putative phosphoribosyl transferase
MGFLRHRYRDRIEAGRLLASRLDRHALADPIVLALPRGGVPVATEVARALDAPLDVLIVRKLGFPGHRELAVGAIASGGARALNPEVAALVHPRELERIERRERAELERRERVYRGDRPLPALAGRTVILVDDGLATGATMRAAVAATRSRHPARIVVAVPVAPPDTVAVLRDEADEVVCPLSPEPFQAIGLWYDDFSQVEDDEVRELLEAAWRGERRAAQPADPRARHVTVASAGVELDGLLTVPAGAAGLVIFAHGSGSSRLSSRNRFVARALEEAGLATLLFDLLTETEESVDERTGELRFDIGLLARRLGGAIEWARSQPALAGLSIGLFGASTGAAAALIAAAERPDDVAAVVSRGGRPDLAGAALASVRAPTLLLVGGADRGVLELNRAAAARLRAPHELSVVPGASHLFEEPGALATVARRAAGWFREHLAAGPRVSAA